mmetsp:Transcript_35843/g.116199  ORF Transcript_35843/g.116199 Transcript_35843/m.116199 type:complete len:230 (-) Transcript_35843:49-738(-)
MSFGVSLAPMMRAMFWRFSKEIVPVESLSKSSKMLMISSTLSSGLNLAVILLKNSSKPILSLPNRTVMFSSMGMPRATAAPWSSSASMRPLPSSSIMSKARFMSMTSCTVISPGMQYRAGSKAEAPPIMRGSPCWPYIVAERAQQRAEGSRNKFESDSSPLEPQCMARCTEGAMNSPAMPAIPQTLAPATLAPLPPLVTMAPTPAPTLAPLTTPPVPRPMMPLFGGVLY